MFDLIAEVDKDTFQNDVVEASSSIPILVDCWADWCAPCKALTPLLEDLAEKYENKIKVVKLNTAENPTVGEVYNVKSLPTLLIFKNGEVIAEKTGPTGKAVLNGFVDENI